MHGTLVIGYGNPGRRDDALGPQLAGLAESWEIAGLATSVDYQLNVEHAAEMAEAGLVIFIDASIDAEPPFEFTVLESSAQGEFTTHAMEPSSVLFTCEKVFRASPPSYVLAVRGEDFEMGEGLSERARQNSESAGRFLERLLSNDDPARACMEAARGEIT